MRLPSLDFESRSPLDLAVCSGHEKLLFSQEFSTLLGMEKLSRREFVIAAGIGGMTTFCAMLAVVLLLVLGGAAPWSRQEPPQNSAILGGPIGIHPPPKEVLDREADAIFSGGKKQWQAATWAGQQYACMIKVMAAHPNDSRSRQKMLARLMWAQIDYAFEDQPLDPSFDETFAIIDFMDYQPKQTKRP